MRKQKGGRRELFWFSKFETTGTQDSLTRLAGPPPGQVKNRLVSGLTGLLLWPVHGLNCFFRVLEMDHKRSNTMGI